MNRVRHVLLCPFPARDRRDPCHHLFHHGLLVGHLFRHGTHPVGSVAAP